MISKRVTKRHIEYRFLGIRFSIINPEFIKKNLEVSEKAIKIQDTYDLTPLKTAKKLILFLIAGDTDINGGIMSIYSLCELSREINKDSLCILVTYPNSPYTYAVHDKFLNNEQVYRWPQILKNCTNVDSAIIHIPEYYAKIFYKTLNKKDLNFIKSIKNVHINILNQNIDHMPNKKQIDLIKKITKNVTQTTAHNRYNTQEICNKYDIPTHLFSVNIDFSRYKKYPFKEKEKIIVLSPDLNINKEKIINKLKQEFNGWEFIIVNNLTFTQYMDLISRAYFTITFGEGMDGYFLQPEIVNSIGFAVYNESFFPDADWKDLLNVYNSYEDMYNNLAADMKKLLEDENLYYDTIKKLNDKMVKLYSFNNWKNNLERFYEGKYDFYPN